MRIGIACTSVALVVLANVLGNPLQSDAAAQKVARHDYGGPGTIVQLRFGDSYAGTLAIGEGELLGSFPPKGTRKDVQSVSLLGLESGLVMYSTERPGDKLLVTVSLDPMVPSWPVICVGPGSEVRFGGFVKGGGCTITVAPGGRLCFRKVDSAWAYLCGVGQIDYGGKQRRTIRLGEKSTVDSCLRYLAASNAVQREGGARELGRLSTEGDCGRVVPRLATLLADPVANVRCGAAEGLGLIGRQECVDALKAASRREKSWKVKRFIAEGLALCAGNKLIEASSAPQLLGAEAAKLYCWGRTGWADKVTVRRIEKVGLSARHALVSRLGSADPTERLASVRLLEAAKCVEARETLTRLSESDPDIKVKEAAKEVLIRLAGTDN